MTNQEGWNHFREFDYFLSKSFEPGGIRTRAVRNHVKSRTKDHYTSTGIYVKVSRRVDDVLKIFISGHFFDSCVLWVSVFVGSPPPSLADFTRPGGPLPIKKKSTRSAWALAFLRSEWEHSSPHLCFKAVCQTDTQSGELRSKKRNPPQKEREGGGQKGPPCIRTLSKAPTSPAAA